MIVDICPPTFLFINYSAYFRSDREETIPWWRRWWQRHDVTRRAKGTGFRVLVWYCRLLDGNERERERERRLSLRNQFSFFRRTRRVSSVEISRIAQTDILWSRRTGASRRRWSIPSRFDSVSNTTKLDRGIPDRKSRVISIRHVNESPILGLTGSRRWQSVFVRFLRDLIHCSMSVFMRGRCRSRSNHRPPLIHIDDKCPRRCRTCAVMDRA